MNKDEIKILIDKLDCIKAGLYDSQYGKGLAKLYLDSVADDIEYVKKAIVGSR